MKLLFATVILGAAFMVNDTNAQQYSQDQRTALATEIVELLAQHDPLVTVEKIEASDDEKQIATRYFYLVIDLYTQKKVAEMITVGRYAIHYMLTQSKALDSEDEENAAWFKNLAQKTSFNLASNLWPGWEDEGIAITSEQQNFGYQMALLDLRLVEEMKLPAEKLSTSTWVVGIHHLAARRYDRAITTLETAKQHVLATDSPETSLMVEGYIAIAEILAAKNTPASQQHLTATKQALEKLGTDDARFYADQHQQVLKFFSKK